MPIDEMARAINRDGYSYMKVSVIPDAKFNDETALATHQQISSILETMVLYDRKMRKREGEIIRLRHGLKR
jgi:hypothetical protein